MWNIHRSFINLNVWDIEKTFYLRPLTNLNLKMDAVLSTVYKSLWRETFFALYLTLYPCISPKSSKVGYNIVKSQWTCVMHDGTRYTPYLKASQLQRPWFEPEFRLLSVCSFVYSSHVYTSSMPFPLVSSHVNPKPCTFIYRIIF